MDLLESTLNFHRNRIQKQHVFRLNLCLKSLETTRGQFNPNLPSWFFGNHLINPLGMLFIENLESAEEKYYVFGSHICLQK